MPIPATGASSSLELFVDPRGSRPKRECGDEEYGPPDSEDDEPDPDVAVSVREDVRTAVPFGEQLGCVPELLDPGVDSQLQIMALIRPD